MFTFLHHFFVPSHRNNFRARALHLDVLTLIVLVFTIVSLTISQPAVLGVATDINIQRLIDRTNEERRNNGLSDLTFNNQLANAAAGKAQHMFTNNYWDHFAPDGTSPWDFIVGAGYKYKFAGENLAYNYMFSDDVVNAWMNSPSHRANILRSEYTEVGYAVLNGQLLGEETTLVVQMFGTPQGGNSIVPVAQAQEVEVVEKPAEVQETQQEVVPTKPVLQVAEAKETKLAHKPEESVEGEPIDDNNSKLVQGSLVSPVNASEQGGSFDINSITFNSSTLLIGLLLFVLIMDFIIAMRLKLVRVTSKNLAHIVFLGAILIGVYIIKNGAIL